MDKDIKKYVGEKISVAVPHKTIQGGTFWYYGILKEVNENELKLILDNGIRIIPLKKIISVKRLTQKTAGR